MQAGGESETMRPHVGTAGLGGDWFAMLNQQFWEDKTQTKKQKSPEADHAIGQLFHNRRERYQPTSFNKKEAILVTRKEKRQHRGKEGRSPERLRGEKLKYAASFFSLRREAKKGSQRKRDQHSPMFRYTPS